MEQHINDRRKKILLAVISEYVSTADPVGSRTISKRYELDLSPATIRNVMSDLEELGYFTQPHTSSGRVPTDKAFRFYIEELAQHSFLDRALEAEIRQRTESVDDIRSLVSESSKALSEATQYAGVGMIPRMNLTVFKHIQFIRLARRQVLIVFVTDANLVQNRIVFMEREFKQNELDRMSNYLNHMLNGLTLEQCRARLVAEMQDARAQYDELLRKAVEVSQSVIAESDGQVFIEGSSRMLHEPEFGDMERARSLFRTFEEKSIMVKLLDKALTAPGVHIWMGAETEDDGLEKCAVVTGTYGAGGKLLGTVGVIGPMRMDYGKVVPLVEYTSRLVSKQLEAMHEDTESGEST
jgi:heat-inducible transcriptional repressor